MQVLVTIIGQRKRFCISSKLPGEADATGLKLHFEGNCDKLTPKISVAGHAECLLLIHGKPNTDWITLLYLLLVAVVQSLSCVQLFGTTWTAAHQASKCFTVSRNLLRFMCIESVMLSNLLILHSLLLLLLSILPSIRSFSNESARLLLELLASKVGAERHGSGSMAFKCLNLEATHDIRQAYGPNITAREAEECREAPGNWGEKQWFLHKSVMLT